MIFLDYDIFDNSIISKIFKHHKINISKFISKIYNKYIKVINNAHYTLFLNVIETLFHKINQNII